MDSDLTGSSFLAVSADKKQDDSGLINGTEHISYEQNVTDGDDASSDDFQINDDDEQASGLKHHGAGAVAALDGESSDCDVDEHGDAEDTVAAQVSPPKMNPTARTSHKRNLSDVLEEKSCHLSSG